MLARGLWSPSSCSGFDPAPRLSVVVGMDWSWSTKVLTVAFLQKTVGDPPEGRYDAGPKSASKRLGGLLRPMFLIGLDLVL
jgi:hypothetical protein